MASKKRTRTFKVGRVTAICVGGGAAAIPLGYLEPRTGNQLFIGDIVCGNVRELAGVPHETPAVEDLDRCKLALLMAAKTRCYALARGDARRHQQLCGVLETLQTIDNFAPLIDRLLLCADSEDTAKAVADSIMKQLDRITKAHDLITAEKEATNKDEQSMGGSPKTGSRSGSRQSDTGGDELSPRDPVSASTGA